MRERNYIVNFAENSDGTDHSVNFAENSFGIVYGKVDDGVLLEAVHDKVLGVVTGLSSVILRNDPLHGLAPDQPHSEAR